MTDKAEATPGPPFPYYRDVTRPVLTPGLWQSPGERIEVWLDRDALVDVAYVTYEWDVSLIASPGQPPATLTTARCSVRATAKRTDEHPLIRFVDNWPAAARDSRASGWILGARARSRGVAPYPARPGPGAVAYYGAYRDEVDEWIELNALKASGHTQPGSPANKRSSVEAAARRNALAARRGGAARPGPRRHRDQGT